MGSFRPSLALLLVLGCFSTVAGQCNLNSRFLGVWWSSYSSNGEVKVQDIQPQAMYLRDKATFVATVIYNCKASLAVDPAQYMVRAADPGGDEECLMMYVSDNGLVQAQKQFILESNVFNHDPAVCPTKPYTSVAHLRIKDPFSFVGASCGLPQGTFQSTYQEDETTGSKACEGDVSSQVIINADSITLRTCYTGPDIYDRPYRSKLRCLAKFPAERIGGNSAGGDILVLAYTDANGLARFYCARVKVDSASGTIYLSLDHGNQDTLFCDHAASSYNAKRAGRYTALEFRKYDCQLTPCLNGGQCVLRNGQYVCNCPPEFAGDRCQISNFCSTSPCVNGGVCSDQATGFVCECPIGFTGDKCQLETVECASQPCLNRGQCQEGVARYDCNCVGGYTGNNCQIPPPVSPCASSPCLNAGECRDSGDSYFCVCKEGFFGTNCETEDPCNRNPCRNGGTCSSSGVNYICYCQEGFGGETCDRRLRDCRDQGCGENGVCEVIIDSNPVEYECICDEGWSGTRCENAPVDWVLIGIILGVIGAILLLLFLALCTYCLIQYCRNEKAREWKDEPRPPTPRPIVQTFVIEPPEQQIYIVDGPERKTTPRIIELPSPPPNPEPQTIIMQQRAPAAPQQPQVIMMGSSYSQQNQLALPAPVATMGTMTPAASPQCTWAWGRPVPRIQVQSPTLLVAGPRPSRPALKSTQFCVPVAQSLRSSGRGSVRSRGSTLMEDIVDSFRN